MEINDLIENIARRVVTPDAVPGLMEAIAEIKALPTHAGADPEPQMERLVPKLRAIKQWMDDATAARLREIERGHGSEPSFDPSTRAQESDGGSRGRALARFSNVVPISSGASDTDAGGPVTARDAGRLLAARRAGGRP